MLAGLVLAGLTTVVTETVRSGGHTIKVERLRITDAGQACASRRWGALVCRGFTSPGNSAAR